MISAKPAVSKKQVLMMALAAGVSVANIYYNQPILKDIADSLDITESQAGSVATSTQVGYGLGLFLLVPMGDKVNKKGLILVLLLLLALALGIMSIAANIAIVLAVSVLIGVLSVSAQILLPLTAGLDAGNRGKNVGIVFSGVLVGILAARVLSGFISGLLGWRYVYGISAALVLAVAAMLKAWLPNVKNQFNGHYVQLLQSTLYQFRRFGLLREAAFTGALLFGVFCSFWTTLTFHLSGPPFGYSANVIGLFGLLAIAGALLAPVFGKLADKGSARKSLYLAVGLILFSLVLIKALPHSTIAFVIAVLLLDVGVQIMQVTNLARIYSLDSQSHSRINTIYMTTYFIGGALSTSAGLLCWRLGGWEMVTWQLLIWTAAALLVIAGGSKTKTAGQTDKAT